MSRLPLRRSRPRHVVGLVLLPLVAVIAASCARPERGSAPGSSAGPSASASAERAGGAADSARELSVVVVRPGLDPSDLFVTFLEPVVDAPVVARARGIVRSVEVVEGRRVAAGQVLARLDDEEQRLEYERASAVAAQARAEHDRARKAIDGNLISQHELEVARAKAEAARAEAEGAKLAYDRCTLRSPVAGAVRLARAEPHMVVEEDEVLFRVAETNRLKASLHLPSGLRHRFVPNAALSLVSLSEPSAPPARGRVRLVNPIADPVTGLFHVEIEVAAGPAMIAGAEVRVGGADSAAAGREGAASDLVGAVLPRGAYLEREQDRLFVYKVLEGRARRTRVELGGVGPDGFPVVSGLLVGDLVVAGGQTPPADGAPVEPRVSAGSRTP